MSDPFYVGYEPAAPPALSRFLRRLTAGLLLAGTGLGVTFGVAQRRQAMARFDYGAPTTVTGTLHRTHYPMLQANEASRIGAGRRDAHHEWLLHGEGKHGPDAVLGKSPSGAPLELQGTVIARDRETAFEVLRVTGVPPHGTDPATGPVEDLGTHEFRGEVVDSKCFLGAMVPGNLRTHRACAVRCLLGGITPMLSVRDLEGDEHLLLLLDAEGAPAGETVRALAGLPVTVRGRVQREGEWLFLFAPASAYRPGR